MLFPSIIFLFAFFPAMLALYYLCIKLWGKQSLLPANIMLLLGSICFYAYGEGWNVFLLIGSVFVNWLAGVLLSRSTKHTLRGLILTVALLLDFSALFIFKYLDFSFGLLNSLVGTTLPLLGKALPIGISFFTFQAASYVIDVCRGKTEAESNPLYVGLYISFFPTLLAGPIVRYTDIKAGIKSREHSFDRFSEGVVRFIEGIVKKAVIADSLSVLTDRIFSHISGGLSVSAGTAWLGAIAFTLQIYFDFSGYSDMAIGLGSMFGFEISENFNYPYIASSVRDFWRRWHISLSSWFRDYVYIPLGGNRKGLIKTLINLLLVWLLTGIWHGAGFTFIAWGLMYYFFLALGRLTKYGDKWELPDWIGRIYTMLVVTVGWVIFKSDSLRDAYRFLRRMVGLETNGVFDAELGMYLKNNRFVLIMAIVLSTPLLKKLKGKKALQPVIYISYGVLFVISVMFVLKGGYSPFIYFKF